MISLHGGSPPLNSAHIHDLIQEIINDSREKDCRDLYRELIVPESLHKDRIKDILRKMEVNDLEHLSRSKLSNAVREYIYKLRNDRNYRVSVTESTEADVALVSNLDRYDICLTHPILDHHSQILSEEHEGPLPEPCPRCPSCPSFHVPQMQPQQFMHVPSEGSFIGTHDELMKLVSRLEIELDRAETYEKVKSIKDEIKSIYRSKYPNSRELYNLFQRAKDKADRLKVMMSAEVERKRERESQELMDRVKGEAEEIAVDKAKLEEEHIEVAPDLDAPYASQLPESDKVKSDVDTEWDIRFKKKTPFYKKPFKAIIKKFRKLSDRFFKRLIRLYVRKAMKPKYMNVLVKQGVFIDPDVMRFIGENPEIRSKLRKYLVNKGGLFHAIGREESSSRTDTLLSLATGVNSFVNENQRSLPNHFVSGVKSSVQTPGFKFWHNLKSHVKDKYHGIAQSLIKDHITRWVAREKTVDFPLSNEELYELENNPEMTEALTKYVLQQKKLTSPEELKNLNPADFRQMTIDFMNLKCSDLSSNNTMTWKQFKRICKYEQEQGAAIDRGAHISDIRSVSEEAIPFATRHALKKTGDLPSEETLRGGSPSYRRKFRGGSFGSNYRGLFYANDTKGSALLTSIGEPLVGQSPMFKPFKFNARLPTPSTGIVPTGQYYQHPAVVPLDTSSAIPIYTKLPGGGKKKKKSKQVGSSCGLSGSYSSLFRAVDNIPNSMLTSYGNKHIDKSVISNPFSDTGQLASPTSGITPSGAWLMDQVPSTPCLTGCTTPAVKGCLAGGGHRKNKKHGGSKLLWYGTQEFSNADLTSFGEKNVAGSSMFSPLSYDAKLATKTDGIIPGGTFFEYGGAPPVDGSVSIPFNNCVMKGGKSKKKKGKKHGGNDYSSLHYARDSYPNSFLTSYGLDNIDNSLMFRPHDAHSTIGTPTSGILPVGEYYRKLPKSTGGSKKSKKMKGGQDYQSLFLAHDDTGSRALSNFALNHIDKSPISNPFDMSATIATISDGITPTGAWLSRNNPESMNSLSYPLNGNQKGGKPPYPCVPYAFKIKTGRYGGKYISLPKGNTFRWKKIKN